MSASNHESLPTPPTPLIGREKEISQVLELLGNPEVKLLTLSGPGGVGKTRLAVEVGRQAQRRFEDGVVFVPLAPVRDAVSVFAALKLALGVAEGSLLEAGPGMLELLQDALYGRNLLLILDNFEHVMEAASDLAVLIEAAVGVTFLVTSRAPLRLYGEREFSVPPLTFPSAGQPRSAAVELLLERIRAVQPGFAPDSDKLATLGEIVRRLDGLPLAIELAAARVRLLPPEILLSRLDNRLRLLQGGARNMPDRQQTLRATIDWSYGLLPPSEQRLFGRLGVFVGSCTLEAAEAVCNLDDDMDVFEGILSLAEKNLLKRSGEDETRFTMLETLREYAGEVLHGSGEEVVMRKRHLDYTLRRLALARSGLRGPQQAHWFARLHLARPDLLAAMRFCLDSGQAEQLGHFARVLGWMWSLRADYAALPLLDEALTGTELQGEARAWVLFARSVIDFRLGRYTTAESVARESVRLFEAVGEVAGVAYARNALGLALMAPQPAAAHTALEESLGMARAEGDDWLTMFNLTLLGWLDVLAGLHAESAPTLEEAAKLGMRLGETSMLGWVELGRAAAALQLGQLASAERSLHLALETARQVHAPPIFAAALQGLAAVLSRRGEQPRAAGLSGAAEAIWQAHRVQPTVEREIFKPYLNALTPRLSEPELKRAYAAGQALDEEGAWHFATQSAHELGFEPFPALATDSHHSPESLTPRESEVLILLTSGLSNKQIATRLGTGVYTVSDHVSSVYSKLGVRSRAAATRYALEHHLA